MKKACATFLILSIILVGNGTRSSCDEAQQKTEYKNVHYFMDLSRGQLLRTMNLMRASLGVHCDFCHVVTKETGWQWESDDKDTKKTARRMIQMVLDLNRTNFNGEPKVTCFTCHQGQISTSGLPPLPQKAPPFPTVRPDPGIVNIPAQEIIDRYFKTVGGSGTPASLSSLDFTFKGKQDEFWEKGAVPCEIDHKAPDRWRVSVAKKKMVTMGFDGVTAWIHEELKTRPMTDDEKTAFREIQADLNLFPVPPSLPDAAVRKTTIGDAEVYLLETPVKNGESQSYYFEIRTGLLLRKVLLTQSPIGTIPKQADYGDYHSVNGYLVPHTLRLSYVDPWTGGNRVFTDMQFGAHIDDSVFQMPSGAP